MGKPVTKYCVISRNSRCIISRCCAIVFMGAAILEQQEQQEKVAYKESFPTTGTLMLGGSGGMLPRENFDKTIPSGAIWAFQSM